VLHVGQEVDVFVLGINADEKKIALSIKRTQAEPWSRVAAKYDVNQLVVGTVTQLANFGAFARIEDGIEGLVHVSELSDARISHPRQLVSEGQELLLRIIRIDPQRRRMGLSLRRALEASDDEVREALGDEAVELKQRLLALEVEPDPDAEPEPEREAPQGSAIAEPEVVVEPEGPATAVETVEESNAMSQAFAAAEANAAANETLDVPTETEAATESATETETAVQAASETEEVAAAGEPVDASDVATESQAAVADTSDDAEVADAETTVAATASDESSEERPS
jgi:predicted RNA-binding protein with RPS1 domain